MSKQQETAFGYQRVPLTDKQTLVDDVFHTVAQRYDIMNDAMSGGLHRVWKQDFVNQLAPPRCDQIDYPVLDMAGGTGDIGFRLVRQGGAGVHVTIADINTDMLAVGETRAAKSAHRERLDFVAANAENLPFESRRYKAYTIAFGIRNVPRIEAALSEAYRVLAYGGRFLCLEFSQVDVPLLDAVYDRFSFQAIPLMGKAIAGDDAPYRYLVESIRTFPTRQRFADMMAEAGFCRVDYRVLSGGIVAIHSGWKL